MNKSKIFIILIIVITSLYLVINFFVIGNDRLDFIKKKIPNYFGWKDTVKIIFFPQKKKYQKSYIIRTDGNHSFKLNANNNLFLYSNNINEIEIEITGILKNKKIQCYKAKTPNSHKINLSEFSRDCKSAIYFVGKMDNHFFYFGFEHEKDNRNKNLLVLPSTNFFVYTNNISHILPYGMKEDFIINLNNIPLSPENGLETKISHSIHNLSNILKDYEIILDYEFQDYKLDEYNLIILPIHQEYVSDEFIQNLLSFLDKENKAVLSIGGSNFMRDFELINNDKMIIKKNEFKNAKYYNLNTADFGNNKNCLYPDDWKIQVGELTEPLVNKNIEYFFPKIKCDNDKIIPLLSIQTFDKTSNSKLIHILSDGIGMNFNKIDYMKSKILNELDNILKN